MGENDGVSGSVAKEKPLANLSNRLVLRRPPRPRSLLHARVVWHLARSARDPPETSSF
jgi:hypothetical protein